MHSIETVVWYLIDHVPGAGRSQVVKLLYLVDLESRRYLGRPLSNAGYTWCEQGPFDKCIHDALEALCAQGRIEKSDVPFPNETVAYRYHCVYTPQSWPLADEELAILNLVVNRYGSMELRDLLDDVVYQTRPLVEAFRHQAYGQPLQMDLVDEEARVPGLELERVWRSYRELNASAGRPLQEVMDALRGPASTRRD